MRNFNRDSAPSDRKSGGFSRRDSGGRSSGGGRRDSSRRDSGGRPDMHRAVCAECGQSCEVPFKPTGGKPVYCSNCFSSREGSSSRNSRDRNFSKPMFGGDRKLFKVVCDKCGKDCEVPFEPSPDKPVYCDECFGKGDRSKRGGGANDSSSKLLEELNTKLDKIINILASGHTSGAGSKKEDLKKNDKKKEEVSKMVDKDKKEPRPLETESFTKKTKKETKKPVIKLKKGSKKVTKKPVIKLKKGSKKVITPKAKVLKKTKKK